MLKYIIKVLIYFFLFSSISFAADFKIGKPFVQVGHSDDVLTMAISADSRFVFTGSKDNTIKAWDIRSGREIKTFTGHTKQVNSIVVTKDNRLLISGSSDETVRVWDIDSGKEIKTLKGHRRRINSVAVTPDSKYIISGSGNSSSYDPDNTIRLWDIATGKEVRRFEGHTEQVNSVAVTPDGQYIVSGSGYHNGDDHTVRLWELNTGDIIKVFEGHRFRVNAVAVSADGKTIYSDDRFHNIKVWGIKHQYELKSFVADNARDEVFAFSVTETDTYMPFIPNRKLGLKLLNMTTQSADKFFYKEFIKKTDSSTSISPFRFRSAMVTPDGQYVIGANKRIEVFNFKTGDNTKTFHSAAYGIKAVDMSFDGRYVASAKSHDLEIWDMKGEQTLRVLKGHEWRITDVAITSDLKYAISGDVHGIGKLWDIEKKEEMKSYSMGGVDIISVDISPDGQFVLLISGDVLSKKNTLALINTENGEIRSGDVDKAAKYGFLVDHTGKYVFAAIKDGEFAFRDAKTFEKRLDFKGFGNWDNEVTTTPDGRYAVLGDSNGTIQYRDTKTDQLLLTMISFNDGAWISMTPEGYFNASAGAEKYINILTGPMEVSSVDQYYETFYRPDIVASALKVKSDKQYAVEAPKVKLADVKPAPEVEIVKTKEQTDKEELKVTIKIIPKSGGIGQIRLYLDGTIIKTDGDRALKKVQGKAIYKSYSIKLPKGEHTLKAIVFNEANTMSSKDATFQVVLTYNPIVKPNIYAVVIGINEYENPSISLKYAVADANLFAKTIQSNTTQLFGKVNVKLLTTKAQTTKENITNELKKLQDISPNDLFIFFVASHGMVEDAKYHMITSNVGALSTRGIKKEAIMQDDLKDMIANIPTSKKVIILDTCNSGALGKTLEVALLTRGLNETTAMKVLSRAVGSTIISASSSTQEALEGYKGHGLLTYVLSEGLNGKADLDGDGFVKTLEIANYVEDTVPQIAEEVFKRAQYPYVSPLGQGFPIVRVR